MAGRERRGGGANGQARRSAGARPAAPGRPAGARGRPESRRPAGALRSEAPILRRTEPARRFAEPFLRAKASTRRLAILGAVVLLLALMLVPTFRSWVDQRRQLESLRQDVSAAQDHVRALEDEKRRWTDDAYVEQQARDRLKFVRPGEVSYTILGADQVARTEAGTVIGSVVTGVEDEQRPWYGQMWNSIVLTDGLDRGTTTIDGRRGGPPARTDPSGEPTGAPSPGGSVGQAREGAR